MTMKRGLFLLACKYGGHLTLHSTQGGLGFKGVFASDVSRSIRTDRHMRISTNNRRHFLACAGNRPPTRATLEEDCP